MQDAYIIYKMSSAQDILLHIKSVSTSVGRLQLCVLLFRLIEWCAVWPTVLPAGGLPASIARTSPSSGAQTEIEGERERDGDRERGRVEMSKYREKSEEGRAGQREEWRGEKTEGKKRGTLA